VNAGQEHASTRDRLAVEDPGREANMDIVNARDLAGIADQRGGTRVSLFLPTHRGGPQTARNRIRLKNLLRHTHRALHTDGMQPGQIDSLLEPGHHILDLMRLREQPSDGLALFLGPDGCRHMRVPLRLPELVTVGDRFLVRPLLPLLTAGGHFHLMALSQDEIRLFHGTRFGLDPVELDGLPLAVWQTMPRRRPQVHAVVANRGGAGAGAVFHGGGEVDAKPLVLRHFRRVDQALRELLGGDQAPLVLAGVRHLRSIYHQANTHPQIIAAGIDGSPRDKSPDELHSRAWPLVEPVLRGHEAAAATAHRALQGTGHTSDEPAEVLAAAREGRVETLFLSTDAPEWRTRVAGGRLVRLGDATSPSERLDRAAVATLRHGGTVYAVPAPRMPSTNPMAATLRF
jgi:hypothetical protein